MRRTLIAGVGLVLLSSGIVLISAQPLDPIIGTWELNVAKSTFASGTAPKSETRTYAAAADKIKVTSKGVGADGKPTTGAWTISYDGSDQRIVGDPDIDALTFKRLDPRHVEFTQKKAGKIVATGTRVISPDGKVMTLTTKSSVKGRTVEDVTVFDKR